MVAHDDEKTRFGQRLDLALKHAGIPDDRSRRTRVAKMFGVSTESVRKWLAGESIPDTKRIPKIAFALKVRSEWLLSGTGPMVSGAAPEPPTTGQVVSNTLHEGPPVGPYKGVPVVGMARLGDDGHYEEQGYPVGFGDGRIDAPTNDPNAYALEVKGDSMMPAIRSGWFVVIEPNSEPVTGEFVLCRTKAGKTMIKELTFNRPTEITLTSVNEAHERITVDREEIDLLHYVAFIVPPSKRRLG